MIDIASSIKTVISNTINWTEDDPVSTSVSFTLDEMDPKNPTLQVLLENGASKFTFVTYDYYKIEQDCKITLYVRPVNYMESTITAYKTTFLNAKTQIDKILASKKFSISNLASVDPGGWKDIDMEVGRDTKKFHNEPIVFVSEQVVKVIYYD